MNVKLVIEYDGTRYHGYQIQANSNTVQEELEKVLRRLVCGDFTLYCAGRTDTGVHARWQVCNFRCQGLRVEKEKLTEAMNGLLPDDISVRSADLVSDDFHARFSAKERTYRYVILNSSFKSALLSRYSWHVRTRLELDKMSESAQFLIGTHDFRAFTDASYPDSTVRNVYTVDIRRKDELINIDICANAFTRSMVRNIVGTLTEIGKGKRSIEEMQKILISRDRQNAGVCAPAKGLFLWEIKY